MVKMLSLTRASRTPSAAFKSEKQPASTKAKPQTIVMAPGAPANPTSRREFVLSSVNLAGVAVLGSFFTFGAAPRPSGLGIQDYGGGVQTLALCPPTPNCIATSEEANDLEHFVPPFTYNPEDGRGRKNPASKEQAKKELVDVLKTMKPDGFTPNLVKTTDDYVYVEYSSPWFGFVDDVEFWFKPGSGSRVEYRSASRVGESDLGANRKRIKAIRQELQKKGWASVGF